MHNAMKDKAFLPQWLRMLEHLEYSCREDKVQRWESSTEGQAYQAAHPNSFFPRGLPKRLEGGQAVSWRDREAEKSTRHSLATLQEENGDETVLPTHPLSALSQLGGFAERT